MSPTELEKQPEKTEEPVAAPAAKESKTDKKGRERARSGRNRLIAIIAGAAVAVAAVIALIIIIHSAANGEIAIYDANAFFVSSKDGGETKYALYKKNGEKITDFIYSQVGAFVNGYAYVRNLDGKKGIVDDSGKMTVDFDEYEDIMPRIGIYEVSKDNKEKLILGNGDELASEYRSYDYSSNAPYVAVKYEGDKYELYNALGKKLAEFESSENPVFSDDDPKTASALSYKGGLIVLSNKNFRPVTTHGTDTIYDIDEATEDGKVITFAEHGKHYDKDAKRAIFNEKVAEFGDKCSDLDLFESSSKSGRMYVTCEVDGDDKLIRKNEVTDLSVKSYGDGYVVYDEDHYAYYDSNDKKVDFYVNGEKKNTISSDYRISPSFKGFVVSNYKAKTVTLYDIEGNEVYKLSDTSSSSELNGIDNNDHIVVKDGKQESTKRAFIINKDGKEISGHYNSVTPHGEYYTARGEDTADLLNKDGEVIISGEYSEFSFYDDDKIVLGKKGSYEDRSYDLIDVSDKKVITNIKGSVSYYDAGYIRAVDGNKTSYYTRDGKLVYEYGS